jgi:hypothetical protein
LKRGILIGAALLVMISNHASADLRQSRSMLEWSRTRRVVEIPCFSARRGACRHSTCATPLRDDIALNIPCETSDSLKHVLAVTEAFRQSGHSRLPTSPCVLLWESLRVFPTQPLRAFPTMRRVRGSFRHVIARAL